MRWVFHGVTLVDETKIAYENWLLSKGLQELARGVRDALEQAYIFCGLVEHFKERDNKSKWSDVRDVIIRKRRDANDLRFPHLMEQVSQRLTLSLDFVDQFLSLQNVRNALEHRGGRVTSDKLDKKTGKFVLSFPRFKLYYEKGGEEIEVAPGTKVEPDGPEESVMIKGRLVVQDREFKLGEQIVFKREEFYDVAWGCWLFAQELVRKMPTL
jgi:hypothetical protein